MAVKAARKGTPGRPAARLTRQQVRVWRLRRHYLDQRAPREAMLEVIAEIGGLHAQHMSSDELPRSAS